MYDGFWISLILVALNVFQFWHWSKQVQCLVDKVMSKNYAEYAQIKEQGNTDPSPQVRLPDSSDEEQNQILKELNGMFGT